MSDIELQIRAMFGSPSGHCGACKRQQCPVLPAQYCGILSCKFCLINSTASRPIYLGPDPSEAYRPGNEEETNCPKGQFRNYQSGQLLDRVYTTYKLMHTQQTVDFVKKQQAKWGTYLHTEMSIMEALDALDQLVDESDPDVDFPNSFHAYQTAEGIRKVHPDKDWFQLVGLVHDIGKMMALWGEPQWAVVGDTFPVGCKFQNSIVFRDSTFDDNPDTKDSRYNTEYGIYGPHCGLSNILMSWGHDEYMYRVLKFNNCSIPEEGLYMIRFHSFYPWHNGGDYMHLCNEKDKEMLHWVKEFNKFDLYTKSTDLPDVEELKPYYQFIIDKYCPGKLHW
ncbi:inositol oxygenase [Latimeria chalumnae]|uniref:inositol oxygenase n=1 Tax=Latimeria chalumnae TaxID=7897 RepID=UPI00313D517F